MSSLNESKIADVKKEFIARKIAQFRMIKDYAPDVPPTPANSDEDLADNIRNDVAGSGDNIAIYEDSCEESFEDLPRKFQFEVIRLKCT